MFFWTLKDFLRNKPSEKSHDFFTTAEEQPTVSTWHPAKDEGAGPHGRSFVMPLWASSYLCEYLEVCMLSYVQLFVTLIDCSPPCSSVHGILQAGILEWVAISSSRGSS